MRPEHRHQLKTNELAQWVADFPQWSRENAKIIISVFVAAVLAIVVAYFYWYNKSVKLVQKQRELTSLIASLPRGKMQILRSQDQDRGIDNSYVLLQIAGKLESAAQNTKNDHLAALAFIKRAEALRSELHYRLKSPAKKEVEATIKQAKNSYKRAIERILKAGNSASGSQKSSPNPSLMAKAQFGLGLCEEEIGSFEKAREIYRDISTNPDFEGTVGQASAKLRLETMDDYQQKVVFRPAAVKSVPKPPPTEVIQPQFQLNPADSDIMLQTPDNQVEDKPHLRNTANEVPNLLPSQ